MSNIDIYKNKGLKITYICDLITDSYVYISVVNTFIIFNSINNNLYLIYSTKNKSIIIFNLIKNQILTEIKNAHKKYITNFRYFFDKINNRDLFMSISSSDNNIKIWSVYNCECIIDIKNVNKKGEIYSACYLYDNHQNYIIASNYSFECNEKIKVFDFDGNLIKELKYSNNEVIFIDSYYDKQYLKNYIITGNKGDVKSYDYNENELYHNYIDGNDYEINHTSIIITSHKKNIILIESSTDGFIRMWNFHIVFLIQKIKMDSSICGICLWNNECLFGGSFEEPKYIEESIYEELMDDNEFEITIKYIIHPKYGECLLSQGYYDYKKIKLWKIINNK